MRRVRFIPLVVCATFATTSLQAQWQMTADVGVSRLRQAGIPESNAFTLGTAIDFSGDRSAATSNFLATRTSVDRWTFQGFAAGSLVGMQRGATRFELTGLLSTFTANNASPTVSSELMARARTGGAMMGSALGLGAGTFSHDSKTAPLLHAQGDLWRTVKGNRFLGEASLVTTTSRVDALSYADLSTSWRRDYQAVSVGAAGGMRTGFNGMRADGWASVDATTWLTPRSALVFAAGRTLEDIVRGAPRTTFFSVAVRFAAQSHAAPATRRETPSGPQIVVERTGDGQHQIEVHGVSASRVEVMGDFTNWNPITLDRRGEHWSAQRTISPGLHRVALRLDGGEWTAPANLPHVTDDLGGTVGLITVP